MTLASGSVVGDVNHATFPQDRSRSVLSEITSFDDQLFLRWITAAPGRPPSDRMVGREKQPQRGNAGREVRVEPFACFNLGIEPPDVIPRSLNSTHDTPMPQIFRSRSRRNSIFQIVSRSMLQPHGHGSSSKSVRTHSTQNDRNGKVRKKLGGEISHAAWMAPKFQPQRRRKYLFECSWGTAVSRTG